jgi:hypothetical protein
VQRAAACPLWWGVRGPRALHRLESGSASGPEDSPTSCLCFCYPVQAGSGPFACPSLVSGLVNGTTYASGSNINLVSATSVILTVSSTALLAGWPYSVTAFWGDNSESQQSGVFAAPAALGSTVDGVSFRKVYRVNTTFVGPYLMGLAAGIRPAGPIYRDWQARVWVSRHLWRPPGRVCTRLLGATASLCV